MSDTMEAIGDWLAGTVREAAAEDANRHKVLSYWCKIFKNAMYSPKEFYTSVVRNLEERKVEGLDPMGSLLRQAGIFSPRRLYLRLRRERIVFEICAAPFADGVFVSSRLFDLRRSARWFHYLMAVLALLTLGGVVGAGARPVWGTIAMLGFGAAVWSFMRLASYEIVPWLSRILPELPVFGPIYESWYHPDTFYRQDVNHAYRDVVHNAVMASIDEMTKALGLRPLSELERKPILRELNR